jgi:hypothetical protein
VEVFTHPTGFFLCERARDGRYWSRLKGIPVLFRGSAGGGGGTSKEVEDVAGNERITSVQLGDYLDGRLEEGLQILRQRNPGIRFEMEQLIRLSVGYGLNSLFRQEPRRRTELAGFYHKIFQQDPEERMVVEDLSLRGARLRVFIPNHVEVNEVLQIRFTLDDPTETVLIKSVVTKNVIGQTLGVAFFDPQPDALLESYLQGTLQ